MGGSGKWGFGPGQQQVFSSSAANELDDDADDDVAIAAQCANQQLGPCRGHQMSSNSE